MNETTEHSVTVGWRLIKRVVLLVAAVYLAFHYGPGLLGHLQSVFLSVLAAVLLTYALLPSVEWVCKSPRGRMKPKTHRLLAVTIVMLVFLGLIAACIALFISPIKQETTQFSQKIGEYSEQTTAFLDRISKWYGEAVPSSVKQVVVRLDYSKAAGWISRYAERILTATKSSLKALLEIVLIPVLAFYFLLDHKSIGREMFGLVPRKKRRDALIIGRSIGEILQSYIFGQMILCVIAGVLTGLFLWAMAMPYIVVLALFAAFTRAIPVIGPVASGVPIVLVGLLYSPGHLAVPLYLLTFIIVMHFAESKFIMPHLIGERLHLNPAVVIIVLLIGAEFFGLIGMFLAAPVAAIIRELIRYYYIQPPRPKRKQELRQPEPAPIPETTGV